MLLVAGCPVARLEVSAVYTERLSCCILSLLLDDDTTVLADSNPGLFVRGGAAAGDDQCISRRVTQSRL